VSLEAFNAAAEMAVDPKIVSSVAASVKDVKAGRTVSVEEVFP